MSSTGERFLLPAGLSDGLAPDAGFEAAIVERLIGKTPSAPEVAAAVGDVIKQ